MKWSWKDLVERTAGPEKKPEVYNFEGPNGEGIFKEPVDQSDTGPYAVEIPEE